jgi:hypothetical protein
MRLTNPARGVWLTLAAGLLLAACDSSRPTAPILTAPAPTTASLVAIDCTANVAAGAVRCGAPSLGGARGDIIGGQGMYLRLTSSNVFYDEVTDTLSFDVTVQNLLNESIGTPDGVIPAVGGIMVFFNVAPTTTSGSGTVTVANADGTDLFTASNQSYFRYDEILATNQVSQPKTWKMVVPAEAAAFTFRLYVQTERQPKLVINEVMVNRAGTGGTNDLDGDWFEVYNAGTLPVQMQGLVITDSAA